MTCTLRASYLLTQLIASVARPPPAHLWMSHTQAQVLARARTPLRMQAHSPWGLRDSAGACRWGCQPRHGAAWRRRAHQLRQGVHGAVDAVVHEEGGGSRRLRRPRHRRMVQGCDWVGDGERGVLEQRLPLLGHLHEGSMLPVSCRGKAAQGCRGCAAAGVQAGRNAGAAICCPCVRCTRWMGSSQASAHQDAPLTPIPSPRLALHCCSRCCWRRRAAVELQALAGSAAGVAAVGWGVVDSRGRRAGRAPRAGFAAAGGGDAGPLCRVNGGGVVAAGLGGLARAAEASGRKQGSFSARWGVGGWAGRCSKGGGGPGCRDRPHIFSSGEEREHSGRCVSGAAMVWHTPRAPGTYKVRTAHAKSLLPNINKTNHMCSCPRECNLINTTSSWHSTQPLKARMHAPLRCAQATGAWGGPPLLDNSSPAPHYAQHARCRSPSAAAPPLLTKNGHGRSMTALEKGDDAAPRADMREVGVHGGEACCW